MSKVKWGILSTANIGIKRVIPAIIAGHGGVVAAIASRDAGRAARIAARALIVLPHTPVTFALALIGENVFQSAAIVASTAIAFETIGDTNPLAATTYCLMVSAFNIANTYMLIVDGWGYSWRGVAGSYATDAVVSLTASFLLALFLVWQSRRRKAILATSEAL
jgi:MFS transporter, PAT family, beta-lactamase induction signal transducer AmpG